VLGEPCGKCLARWLGYSRGCRLGCMGVPHRLDDSVRSQYLNLLRTGVRRHAAARSLNVHPDTVRNARRRDPSFDEDCVLAEQEAVESIENELWEAATERKEPWAIQMLLKQLDPDRWKEKKQLDVKVSGVVELDPGVLLERVMELQGRLKERAIERGEVIDVIALESGT